MKGNELPDLEKPRSQMTADELWALYDHETRHASMDQQALIEAPGPLSDDSFIRDRQELFREYRAKSGGVIPARKPGELMHCPV